MAARRTLPRASGSSPFPLACELLSFVFPRSYSHDRLSRDLLAPPTKASCSRRTILTTIRGFSPSTFPLFYLRSCLSCPSYVPRRLR